MRKRVSDSRGAVLTDFYTLRRELFVFCSLGEVSLIDWVLNGLDNLKKCICCRLDNLILMYEYLNFKINNSY